VYRRGVNVPRLAAVPATVTAVTPGPGLPCAFALNETATCEDVEVTLLALVVVDDFARISGFVRIGGRLDVALSGVPTLAVSSVDGSLLRQVGAHLLPHGPKATWVSWLYERPAALFSRYEARIDRIDLGHWGGRRPPNPVSGPWDFAFTLPTPTRPVRLISRVD
jgi:hypothetical protein